MTKARLVPVVVLATLAALALSLLAGWVWNTHESSTTWNLAHEVQEAGGGGYFLGEKGGRAPTAVDDYERASAKTLAVVWALFALTLAGLALERHVRGERIIGPQNLGFAATVGFMAVISLSWAAVRLT